MIFLAGARLEMDALEAAKSEEGSALDGGEFQIELDDFISGNFSGVGDGDVGGDWIAGVDRRLRQGEIAVTKRGVAQAVAEGIQRFGFEIAVGAAFHRVILEV